MRHPFVELGQGTDGVVYSCDHPSLGNIVVKVPTDNSGPDEFNAEAQNLAMFRHPNIVQYFGRVRDNSKGPDAVPGIVMERMSDDLATYLDGCALSFTGTQLSIVSKYVLASCGSGCCLEAMPVFPKYGAADDNERMHCCSRE